MYDVYGKPAENVIARIAVARIRTVTTVTQYNALRFTAPNLSPADT
jgi:hypothetical protein